MKKFLSLMLAVMLLALPVASLAEFNTDLLGQQKAMTFTLTFTDANFAAIAESTGEKVDEDEAAVFAMLNDLINAIGLTGYLQQASADTAQFGLSLTLTGNEAINVQALFQKDGVYTTNNLLGQDTVLVTPEQLAAAMEDAKEDLIAQDGPNAELPAAELKQMLAVAKLDEISASIQEVLDNPGDYFGTIMQKSDLDTMELTNFLAAFEKIAEKAEKSDASTAPAGSDKAESVITLKLNKDDIGTLLDAFMKDFEATHFGATYVKKLNQSLDASEEKMTVDDVLKTYTDLIKGDVVVTLCDDGNMASATVKTAMLEKVGSDNVVDMEMVILSSKMDNQQKVTITTSSIQSGEKIDMLFELDIADKENATFICTMTGGDTLAKMYGTIQNTTDNHVTMDVKIEGIDSNYSFGIGFLVTSQETENNMDVQVKLMSVDGATTYMTMHIDYELADMKPAVNTADAVQPLAMSEEEMQAWTASLESGMQMELVKIIQYLPTSVLQMMMQQ